MIESEMLVPSVVVFACILQKLVMRLLPALFVVVQGRPSAAEKGETKCVVCEKAISNKDKSVKVEHEGKTVYLCCEGCAEKFLQFLLYIAAFLGNLRLT